MAKKYKTKRITLSNFNTSMNADDDEFSLQVDSARICYNAKSYKGALVTGNGIVEGTFPIDRDLLVTTRKFTYTSGNNILKIWRFSYFSTINNEQEYMLMLYCTDKKLYFVNLFATSKRFDQVIDYTFKAEPTAISFKIDGKEVIAFVSPKDPITVWSGVDYPYQVDTVPKFLCICYHNNRLFAIEDSNNNVVLYSSKSNPLDWTTSMLETGGGSISLNEYKGELKNLISLGDYLYVFRDFGIAKISTYASKENYNAVNIFTSSCKIYCNTACVCDSSIYFLAEDGLYEFDGFNVKKVDVKFQTMFQEISQDNINTCYFNSNLFIACNFNFADDMSIGCEAESGYKNNVLIQFNTQTKTYNITRGVDVGFMLAIKDLFYSRLTFCLNGTKSQKLWQLDDSGKYDTLVLPTKWEGGKINFGEFDKNKILKEVNLICRKSCYLTVKSERDYKKILIPESEDISRIRLNVKGKNISLSFDSAESGEMYVLSPQFVFKVEE